MIFGGAIMHFQWKASAPVGEQEAQRLPSSRTSTSAALTPTWSETAWLADYVLPMGVGGERHDLQSQETHAGRWIAFRQPVSRLDIEEIRPADPPPAERSEHFGGKVGKP